MSGTAVPGRSRLHGARAMPGTVGPNRMSPSEGPAGADGRGAWLSAIVGFIFLATVLGDRLVVSVQTGGRGALSLLTFAAPMVAALAAVHVGPRRALRFTGSPTFIIGALPFLLLSLVLPILGVMFNRYPDRTLMAATAATTSLSFVVLGAVAGDAPMRTWGRWLMVAIVAQLAYATAQLVYLSRLPGWEILGPLHAWDLSLQGVYGAFVQARSTGLLFNPNELGLWAAIAVVLAWQLLRGGPRMAAVLMALVTLLLSQSRGASVALLTGVATSAILAVARGRTSVPRNIRSVASIGAVVVAAVVLVIAVEPSQGIVDRFSALVAVAVHGPTADANLAGRLAYWSSVIDLNALYPWGTWGPPELLLGSAVDSTWFRVFAQGSVAGVGALVLLLAVPLATQGARFSESLTVVTVIMAVAALTQTPFDYPISFLFWGLLGAVLQASRLRSETGPVRVPASSPGPPPDRDSRRTRESRPWATGAVRAPRGHGGGTGGAR